MLDLVEVDQVGRVEQKGVVWGSGVGVVRGWGEGVE